MNLNNIVLRSIIGFLIAVAFVVAGFFIVTYAAGYTVDFKSKQISKTGLITVRSTTELSQIYVNSNKVGTKSVTLRNLEPGNYKIVVSKEGYQDWQKSIELKEQEAVLLDNIILFKKSPIIEEYTTGGVDVDNISTLADQDGLASNSGEIFINADMVTRFSGDVFGLSWYPAHKYVAFTLENKFYIMSVDGKNLCEIASKNSESPVIFTNSGKYVVFENNGKIFRSQIR